MTDKDQSQQDMKPVGGLARKLAATKEDKGRVGGSLTLKALRRAVARAAEDLCELPMAVIAARQTNRKPEDLTALLSDKHLLVLLDCPKGRIGAATLDAAAVTALIQKQTMGAVMGMASDERAYTPTDAAMMAEFLEKLFGKVVAILEEQRDRDMFEGYRFGAQIEDVRTLVLGMEADEYRVINLNVDLDCGKMQGEIRILLPEPSAEENAESQQIRGPRIGAGVGSMRAELSAVLCKVKMPLREFTSLKVGDLMPLDQAYLYETDLLAINGTVVAKGRMGQMNGSKAVRINVGSVKLPGHSDGGFSDNVGGPATPADAGIGLSIAAHGLQEPGGLGGDLGGLGGDLGGLGGDLGGGLGGDLGGGLGGDLGTGLPDDLPLTLDEPGGLPMGDLGGDLGGDLAGDFNAENTAVQISDLAGLGGDLPDLPETGT